MIRQASTKPRRPLTPTEELLVREQPISWTRALGVGMLGSAMMMAFVDCFFMLERTPFSFEHFVGSLLHGSPYGARTWFPGLLANLALGGVFGMVYAYAFENIFKRATTKIGIGLGLVHVLIAGTMFFPFVNVLLEEMGMELYPNGFGILGSSIDPATPLLIIVGHLIFGATMGVFYGPVGVERLRMRYFEPGETGQPYIDPNVITPEEDPIDRAAI